jgi:signal transduction histidine kinase
MQREQYIHRVQRWISASVSRLDDGFVSMLTDITELKSSQRELEHQSQYLDRILNTSLNAVVTMEAVVDHDDEIIDLRYVQVNDRFLEWLSVSREEVIGQTMLQFFPNTRESGIFEVYRAVIQSGDPQHVEVSYAGPEGRSWFDLSVARLDAVSAVGTFNDITRSREAFRQVGEQKTLLDNILKHSSNGISVPEVMRDEKGAIVDVRTILVNDAAVAFTGLSREAYLSKTAVEIEPNIMQSPYYQLCLKTLATGISATIQYKLESSGRWLEITISRMDSERLITIFTDVTSSKEAQLAIERSASKIRAVIDTSQSGVFTGSPIRDTSGEIVDFRFNLVNKALAAFTEQEPEALIGDIGSRWFARYKDNGMFDRLKNTYETGNRNQFDFFYEGKKVEAWINIVITKLDDEIIGTFTDFSSLKKTQLALERTVAELQRSNETLQEFAYAASHDLKEPVRKVRIFSDQLNKSLSDRMTPEEKSYFQRMERASSRMGSLIEDLLSYSQVSFSPKSYEEIDMDQLMQQVLSDLDLEIEEKSATVHVEPLFTIRGYPRQLQQAFQNLIANGLKYGKPGVPPLISIGSRKVTGREALPFLPENQLHRSFHCVTVADDGVGFEQKDADRIFNVFTRLHANSDYRGSGVGLSIVRKVVQNHNGYVTAQSEPGIGSRFHVFLPVD